MYRIPPQRDSGSDSPQVKAPITLEERPRGSLAKQTNNEGTRSQRSACGRITHRCLQIKEEIFLCTPLEVEHTSFQETVDRPNHKKWIDDVRDEMDLMIRNKV